jgi:hypothetical protein
MGSKGSGGGSNQMGFQATTSTYTPNPEAMAAYRNALGMAENVAQIPFEQYQGQMLAGFTPDQLAAFQGTREMQGMAQPYINAAAGAVNRSLMMADPRNFTPAALQQYYNPYQQNVIESTQRMMEQQNAQQQADLTARAIQQGAYGGDRSGVARAALMGQQALANQQVLSGLQQQGYQQAVSQYNQQQQQAIGAAQQGAYSLGQLGLQGQQAALQGIQALLGTGGMQQQLGQQQLSAAYNQFMQARAYPYQQANFYAGIASGIAPNMGGTTNTFGIGNSQTQQQQASGGGGGAGLISSALSFLPMLLGGSDRDDKTDIKYIGRHPETGERLYEYRYKGDPKTYPKVVGPMAQDIEKDEPERVHEIGGHKVVEGLGHLKPSEREGRADGGGAYGSYNVDPYAYQQPAYQADQRFDPGFQTGLNAVIDPAMANEIARSRWVSQNPDQSQSDQAVNEQMQYRNPEFNLFPYFQEGEHSQSPFDGNAERPQMYADGGGVGGFGDLIKAKSPFGAANEYIEALPITPGKAHIPEPPKMNWLPGLPGGGPSSSGGGGGGGGGGSPKLPKLGGSKAASAGAHAPDAAMAGEHAAAAAPATHDAAAHAPAMDMGSAPAPAMDAGLGGMGGMGGGLENIFSGLGGILPMFNRGGRAPKADGGAGGMGSSGFAGALGPGAGAIPGVIGEPGSGTLGSLTSDIGGAPTKGPMGDMSYKGWLGRAMELDPGRQTTPEEQGQPSLPKPGSQPPRQWMPGESQSKVIGNQNEGINPMLMMGMGKMGSGLALASIIGQQQAQQNASTMQKEAQAKRAEILAKPQTPAGYSTSLASNIVNPRTGLFNVNYGTYYMPPYAAGGRVGKANGGGFNYGPSMQLYYDMINSGKMTPEAAAGYAGNFSYEASGRGKNQINPAAVEGGQPFNKAGIGYAQWTNAHRGNLGRHSDFLNFAKQTGQPWNTHLANLDYFNKERSENPFVMRADEKVQAQPTIREAATHVMQDYERPGAAEAAKSLHHRIGMAEHIGDIAQAGNPFEGTALAEESARSNQVLAEDHPEFTTGGQFAEGGRVYMARGGGLDERTSALANRAMNYFLSKGYSKAAAAGIVGNLIHESGGHLNPAAHGDLSLGAARSAWGIGQWRENRFRNLQNFAKAIGRDWKDFDTQLAFVDRELKSDYRNAYRGITSARTPQEAAAQMMMYYEIPQHRVAGVPSTYRGWGQRANLASMLGGQEYSPTSAGSYGAPATAPIRTLAVRPLTGERAGVVASDNQPTPAPAPVRAAAPASPYPGSNLNRINPADPSGPLLGDPAPKVVPATAPAEPKPGFNLASLSPISAAYASDRGVYPPSRFEGPPMSRGPAEQRIMNRGLDVGYGPDHDTYGPGISEVEGIRTQFGQTPYQRSMLAETPYAQTMVGAPLSPFDDGSGFSEEKEVVSADRKEAPKAPASKSGEGPYWGDYRDYEPWKSDPIGGFFDELTGDRPHSAHKGASMYDTGAGETQGGGFDILKELGFADGGAAETDADKTRKRPGVSSTFDPLGSLPERLAAEQLQRMSINPNTPAKRPGWGSSFDTLGSLPERLAMEQRAKMAAERPVYRQDPNFRPTYHANMGPMVSEMTQRQLPDWNPNIPAQQGGYPSTIGQMYPVESVVAEQAPQPTPASGAGAEMPAPAASQGARSAPQAGSQGENGGPYWGDYRDYEPWRSDPIGLAFDQIMGEKPHSSHKGASMWDVGGGETAPASLGDLFRQFGGRVKMQDGGDPLAGLDSELFSQEPMADDLAGFSPQALAEATAPESEEPIVATDRQEQPVQPAAKQGLGGLRSPITGQPMEFGPLSQAMLAAGLGMMASDRVNPLQAIGEGGLRGLEYYQEAKAGERAREAANERLSHQRAKERADELYRQNALELRRNLLEAQERARIANEKRLELQSSPDYKARVAQEAAEAKKLADIGIKTQEDAMSAQGNISRLSNFEKALEEARFRTGAGASVELALRRGAAALGYGDEEAVQLMGDFESGAIKDLLTNAGGSLGAGISRSDAETLAKMSTSLSKSPAENLSAIRAAKAVEQRKIDIAEFQRQYREAHGGVLDGNYYNELSKWAAAHPITATLGQTKSKESKSSGQSESAPSSQKVIINPVTKERMRLNAAGTGWEKF